MSVLDLNDVMKVAKATRENVVQAECSAIF